MSCCLRTTGTKMKINEIIDKHFDELKSKCHNDDRVISMSRTSEDVLQDVCLTAMRKFKQKDIGEEEGMIYLQKTLWYELKFQVNRVDPRMSYMDDLSKVDKANDE